MKQPFQYDDQSHRSLAIRHANVWLKVNYNDPNDFSKFNLLQSLEVPTPNPPKSSLSFFRQKIADRSITPDWLDPKTIAKTCNRTKTIAQSGKSTVMSTVFPNATNPSER